MKEQSLEFDAETAALISSGVNPKKIRNKVYILQEDYKVYPSNIVDTIKKWTDAKINEKATKKEWQQMFENEKITLAKKGDVFFKSKLYTNRKGKFYMYPATDKNNAQDILVHKEEPGRIYFVVEHNKFRRWENHLSWIESKFQYFKDAKFKYGYTNELSFEQIHMVAVHNSRLDILDNKIAEIEKEKNNIKLDILRINYADVYKNHSKNPQIIDAKSTTCVPEKIR